MKTGLFEQDIAAMCEAQQEEEHEQAEVEEVSNQDDDEIYKNCCATDAVWQGLAIVVNVVQTVLCMRFTLQRRWNISAPPLGDKTARKCHFWAHYLWPYFGLQCKLPTILNVHIVMI